VWLQVAVQSVAFAVLAVVGMALMMTPLLLYAFDLQAAGWHWSHAALFTCMIASTDAVAVTAVLKKANGPETLAVLMEGESLFNDATSIVLFEVGCSTYAATSSCINPHAQQNSRNTSCINAHARQPKKRKLHQIPTLSIIAKSKRPLSVLRMKQTAA
jgi:hypothetical protein